MTRSTFALGAGGAVAAVVALGACGGPARPTAGAPPRGAAATTAPGDAGVDAAGAAVARLASLDAIAARGPGEAPLMRELARVDGGPGAKPLGAVRAERDLCARALYDASQPVRVFFADEAGKPRGEAASGASGAAPPRGPACVKKNDVLRLVAEGDPATIVRAVIFAAP